MRVIKYILVVIFVNIDIGDILGSWGYQPNFLTIRKIMGDDGEEKLQIRISLGILQMETENRPDGRTPHDAKSLLEYYNSLMEEFREQNGTAESFTLTKRDMRELDDELMQYYHRRICFFALGDYRHAKSDAEHNLQLMDIIKEHCKDQNYTESHEQFRPFVVMERARAIALKNMASEDYADAMKHVNDAMDTIERFYEERSASAEEIQNSRELATLRQWRNRIHQAWEGGIAEDEGDDMQL